MDFQIFGLYCSIVLAITGSHVIHTALISIYTYKRAVCVYLFVCFLSATRDFLLCGAASESESRSRRGRPGVRGAHAVQLTSQRKNRSADAFHKQNRTRAHAVVYVTAEILKKREKENQHATSQVQFTVCLLLECLLFESY